MDFSWLMVLPKRQEWVYSLGFVFFIVASFAIGQVAHRFNIINREFTRKFVHITIGTAAAFAPLYFESALYLIVIALFFAALDLYAIRRGYLKGVHGQRLSYGTFYFPLVYTILILSCWNIDKRLITVGIMLFAVPDAIAAVVGQSLRKVHSYVLVRDQKTVEGSLGFFVSAIIVLWIVFMLVDLRSDLPVYQIILTVSLLSSVIEMFSSRGSDNLFVPLGGALLLHILLSMETGQFVQFQIGMALAFFVAIASYYARFLTLSGSVMTFLLGAVLFGIGGLPWTIPILTFFIFSSILSKTKKDLKLQFKNTFEKSSVRDYWQVLANGGTAGVLAILNFYNPMPELYVVYVIITASVTADTWATELGVLSKKKPRLITSFKPVDHGVSGAITTIGSMGAMAGSFSIVAVAYAFLNQLDGWWYLLILLLGWSGAMIDSLLGATLQGQYRCCVCGKYTERKKHCDNDTQLIGGLRALNNDVVNMASAGAAAAIYLIVVLFI